MIAREKRPSYGQIRDGDENGPRPRRGRRSEARLTKTNRRPRRRITEPLLDDKTRALIIMVLLSLAFCGLTGLVGMQAPMAFADEGYTHVFPNGNTVQVHADGTVSGTCVMTGNAAVDGVFGGTVTMPDGNSYHAACYERYLGVPNYKLYPGPCDGTYPFEATRNANGTYFVVIKSQNASHGAPGTLPSRYPYQRCYTEEWKLVLNVDVNFSKLSADTSITDGNAEYSVAGAVFDIHEADSGTKITSITMDESGKASYRLAPNKSYYAVETKAPLGYATHPGRIPFRVGAQAGSVTFSDQPGRITLTIRKRDAATGGAAQAGLSLKGAEYEVSSLSTPGWRAIATTDERGVAVVEGIPLGRIAVAETKAPEGYKINSAVRTYEVHADRLDADGVAELAPQDGYAEVPCSFDIELVKYLDSGGESSGLQKPGVGVRFLLISNSTGKTVGTITTDNNGEASTAGKWFGKGERVEGMTGALPYDAKGYTVREDPDSVPAGYQPCPDWHIGADQMVDGATLHYIIDNDFVGSRIQIVKHDAVSGRPVPLAGFEFQVLDERKEPVRQDVWHPNHVVLDRFTTDGSGCVTLPEPLKPGKYFVRETQAVAPYLINGDDIEFAISDDAATAPVTVVRISDERVRGAAKIVKHCPENDCPWCTKGGGLKGASFDVIALEDVVCPDGSVEAMKDEVVGTVKTDTDGIGHIDDLPLGAGSAHYALVETAPSPGHVLDPTPVPFTLSWKDGGTAVVHAEVNHENEPTVVVVDKRDVATESSLDGARFDIWPQSLEHEPVTSGIGTGSLLITDRTRAGSWKDLQISLAQEGGSDGGEGMLKTQRSLHDFEIEDDVAILTDILPGAYVLDISADGDETENDSLHITISPGKATHVQWGDLGLVESGYTLAPGFRRMLDTAFSQLGISTVTDSRGRISLHHLPALKKELMQFLETTAEKTDMNAIGTQDLVLEKGIEATRGDGTLTWCIREILAPDGYVIDPSIHTFKINTAHEEGDDPAQLISISNDFTKLEITKRASENEKPLEGAQLEVTDSEGSVIDRWTSSQEPHRIERIAPGTYKLSELVPPHTHDQAEPIMFNVKPTVEVQAISIYDEEVSVDGRIDKRQEIVKPTADGCRENGDGLNRADAVEGDPGSFSYTLDYRNESSSWVDEFTVDDHLVAVDSGMAILEGITTARAHGDRDGKLNVWYRTNLGGTETDSKPEANATLSDGHENPWLTETSVVDRIGDDGRVLDYEGWKLWAEGISATTSTELNVDQLDLASGERVTDIRLEYGSVSKDFATRLEGWDDEALKDLHDDWDPAPIVHPMAKSGDDAYAPTVLHMKAGDAYRAGCSIDNHACVSLYRNGGGDGLEGYDEDAVHQQAAGIPAVVQLLDQTGSSPLARAATALSLAGGIAAACHILQKRRAIHIEENGARMRCQRHCRHIHIGNGSSLGK